MATKRRKKEVKINVDEKLKKNELSLAFMKAYIVAKVSEDKVEKAKEEFKAHAKEFTESGEEKYCPKKARDYFAETYPEAILPPAKKGGKSAIEELNEW